MRVASGPDPPGSSRCVFERRKRRFLAYTFPSRSPYPRRLAVPTRHGFVRAAPTHPGTSRGRLPSASQSCCDRTTVQVSHLHSINKRLTAHRRSDAAHDLGACDPIAAKSGLGRHSGRSARRKHQAVRASGAVGLRGTRFSVRSGQRRRSSRHMAWYGHPLCGCPDDLPNGTPGLSRLQHRADRVGHDHGIPLF